MPARVAPLVELAPDLAPGPLIGLDLGTKTIGVALSDRTRTIASAVKTIIRRKFTVDAAELLALATKEGVAALVLGLPLNMDGTEGPRAQATRAFARNLAALTDIPIGLLGRAAVDGGGHPHPDRGRHLARQAGGGGRQDGRRLSAAGRARPAAHAVTGNGEAFAHRTPPPARAEARSPSPASRRRDKSLKHQTFLLHPRYGDGGRQAAGWGGPGQPEAHRGVRHLPMRSPEPASKAPVGGVIRFPADQAGEPYSDRRKTLF